jgi:zinc transporter, ZIP family
MGFGGGVLITMLSVDLIDSALSDGGPVAATVGFLFGAGAFSAINCAWPRPGPGTAIAAVSPSPNRRRRGTGEADWPIALGTALDGVPESLAISLSLLEGGECRVSISTLA